MDITELCTLASAFDLKSGVTFPSLAYLDAGTGSMLFQILVASIVSAGVVFGGAMARIRSFVSRVVLRRPEDSGSHAFQANDQDTFDQSTAATTDAATSDKRRAA